MPIGCDGSACHRDEEDLDEFRSVADVLRGALQRPLGKLTEREEQDAILETYMHALGMLK